MSTRPQPLIIRPEDLDQPGGGPLVVKPEELDGGETQAPPPRKGMLSRFRGSLRSGFGLKPEGSLSDDISQIGEGFGQMYHHPLTSANDLVEGLYGSQEDVARKGAARMQSPRLTDRITGTVQGLESFIPGAGPILSRMGEQAEEKDWAGMAGTGLPLVATMDPKPLKGAVGDVMRTPGGEVRTAPRLATQIATGAAGHEMMPYAGGYLGYKAGGPLSEMITPERTPKTFPGARPIPWEAPVESEASAPAASEATQTLRGGKTPFSAPGATSSAPGPGAARGPEGPMPKPRLSARETSEYLKSKGRSTGRLSENIEAADVTRPKEKLSPYMQRKIDEATGRHDASRMAATGATAGEDIRAGTRLSDKIEAEGGEGRLEQLMRRAPGESPAVKSVGRNVRKRSEARARDAKLASRMESSKGLSSGKGGGRMGWEDTPVPDNPDEPRLSDLIKGSVEKHIKQNVPGDPVSGGPLYRMLEGIPKPTMPHQELMIKYGLEQDNEGGLFWSKGPGKEVAPNVQHIQFGVSGKWQAVGKTRSGEVRPIATGSDVASLEKVLRDGIPRNKAKDIFR